MMDVGRARLPFFSAVLIAVAGLAYQVRLRLDNMHADAGSLETVNTPFPDPDLPICPDYGTWSQEKHDPVSDGCLGLPFQRPPPHCRTFVSPVVEQTIQRLKEAITDPDLARLFENAFPNTLDTTIRYHKQSPPLTFIVTGDIDAEWLRDSHRQLSPYIGLASTETGLQQLIAGAIALQARYVSQFPFCNAFHPPPESQLRVKANNMGDRVRPSVDDRFVFECKQELDSLSSFLGLSNEYYASTGDESFMTPAWHDAVRVLLAALRELGKGTYSEDTGSLLAPAYSFQRWTDSGTETQTNRGLGNPVRETGLLRSFFRPSDDATIYQFLVPANAQTSVELQRLSEYVPDADIAQAAASLGAKLKDAIYKHAVKTHPTFGPVFAYEVDGYGGALFMDDANLPSLLSLADCGFVNMTDEIYINTRKLILSDANPYYIRGEYLEGVGGPHVGLRNAWPMSSIVAARTTDDIDEIRKYLGVVLTSTRGLGLVHESVNVDNADFSRPWFAWANSEFAKTILDLEKRGLLADVTAGVSNDICGETGYVREI